MVENEKWDQNLWDKSQKTGSTRTFHKIEIQVQIMFRSPTTNKRHNLLLFLDYSA